MITFVLFNMKLFGSMMNEAGKFGSDVGNKYKAVTGISMGIWCAYPVMYWLCEVTRTLTTDMEIIVYAILDVVDMWGGDAYGYGYGYGYGYSSRRLSEARQL